MPNKEFEKFELKLLKLREESREDFDVAEKVFQETYSHWLKEVFPRDILWAKKYISGSFSMKYVDVLHAGENINVADIFSDAVSLVIANLPLSPKRQASLSQHIWEVWEVSESLQKYFSRRDDISRDPFFALVEDFSMDGDISKEEFLLLQESYEKEWSFLKALESLPEDMRDMFHSHIGQVLSHEHISKRSEFEWEYHEEIKNLEQKGVDIEPVIVFVARSYYKTPSKIRRYENPKRRMRRTFKIALLKILRAKLWNIDVAIMIEKFENGEIFEDFFMLLHELLEIVSENPEWKEIYTLLDLDEDIQDEVFTAEENKKKILQWESLVMKIASLFSQTDSNAHEQTLDEDLLGKILDDGTDIVWEDIYFNRSEDNAWIYAQSWCLQENQEEDNEDEENYDNMSPESAYELLKHEFHKIEEEKRKAFLSGKYDAIDVYNEKLVWVESKLWKISKILGLED